MDLFLRTKIGEFKINERIEFLREELHDAIDNGNANEILKASVALDIEIVSVMVTNIKSNKIMCREITNLFVKEGG